MRLDEKLTVTSPKRWEIQSKSGKRIGCFELESFDDNDCLYNSLDWDRYAVQQILLSCYTDPTLRLFVLNEILTEYDSVLRKYPFPDPNERVEFDQILAKYYVSFLNPLDKTQLENVIISKLYIPYVKYRMEPTNWGQCLPSSDLESKDTPVRGYLDIICEKEQQALLICTVNDSDEFLVPYHWYVPQSGVCSIRMAIYRAGKLHFNRLELDPKYFNEFCKEFKIPSFSPPSEKFKNEQADNHFILEKIKAYQKKEASNEDKLLNLFEPVIELRMFVNQQVYQSNFVKVRNQTNEALRLVPNDMPQFNDFASQEILKINQDIVMKEIANCFHKSKLALIRNLTRILGDLASGSEIIYVQRAKLFLVSGFFAEAIFDGSYIKTLNPQNVEAYNICAHAFFKLKKFDQGLKEALEAITRKISNAETLYILGLCFHAKARLNDFDRERFLKQAIDYLSRCIEINPNYAEAYQLRADCYDSYPRIIYDLKAACYLYRKTYIADLIKEENSLFNLIKCQQKLAKATHDYATDRTQTQAQIREAEFAQSHIFAKNIIKSSPEKKNKNPIESILFHKTEAIFPPEIKKQPSVLIPEPDDDDNDIVEAFHVKLEEEKPNSNQNSASKITKPLTTLVPAPQNPAPGNPQSLALTPSLDYLSFDPDELPFDPSIYYSFTESSEYSLASPHVETQLEVKSHTGMTSSQPESNDTDVKSIIGLEKKHEPALELSAEEKARINTIADVKRYAELCLLESSQHIKENRPKGLRLRALEAKEYSDFSLLPTSTILPISTLSATKDDSTMDYDELKAEILESIINNQLQRAVNLAYELRQLSSDINEDLDELLNVVISTLPEDEDDEYLRTRFNKVNELLYKKIELANFHSLDQSNFLQDPLVTQNARYLAPESQGIFIDTDKLEYLQCLMDNVKYYKRIGKYLYQSQKNDSEKSKIKNDLNQIAIFYHQVKEVYLRELHNITAILDHDLEKLESVRNFGDPEEKVIKLVGALLTKIRSLNNIKISEYFIRFLLINIRYLEKHNLENLPQMIVDYVESNKTQLTNFVSNPKFYLRYEKHIDEIIYSHLKALFESNQLIEFHSLINAYLVFLESLVSQTGLYDIRYMAIKQLINWCPKYEERLNAIYKKERNIISVNSNSAAANYPTIFTIGKLILLDLIKLSHYHLARNFCWHQVIDVEYTYNSSNFYAIKCIEHEVVGMARSFLEAKHANVTLDLRDLKLNPHLKSVFADNYAKVVLLIDVTMLFAMISSGRGSSNSKWFFLQSLLGTEYVLQRDIEISIQLWFDPIPALVFTWKSSPGEKPMMEFNNTNLYDWEFGICGNEYHVQFLIPNLFLSAERFFVKFVQQIKEHLTVIEFPDEVSDLVTDYLGPFNQSHIKGFSFDELFFVNSKLSQQYQVKFKTISQLFYTGKLGVKIKESERSGNIDLAEVGLIIHVTNRYLCLLGPDPDNWPKVIEKNLKVDRDKSTTPLVARILFDLYELFNLSTNIWREILQVYFPNKFPSHQMLVDNIAIILTKYKSQPSVSETPSEQTPRTYSVALFDKYKAPTKIPKIESSESTLGCCC